MEHFKAIIDAANTNHKTLILGFLFVSFVIYFIVIRGCLGNFHCVEIKKSKKRSNKTISMIFSGINKNSMKHFSDWLLCRCYTKEEQKKLYSVLVVVNYIYLIFTVICVLIWILSLIVTSLQWWSSLLICIRVILIDAPALLLTITTIKKH